jgi:hypothetical protein
MSANEDAGLHCKHADEDIGIGDAAQWSGSLGGDRNRLCAGGFRLVTREKQAR